MDCTESAQIRCKTKAASVPLMHVDVTGPCFYEWAETEKSAAVLKQGLQSDRPSGYLRDFSNVCAWHDFGGLQP
jgi:hypothetical protein